MCHFCLSNGTKQNVLKQVSQTHNSAPNSCYWLNQCCYVGLTRILKEIEQCLSGATEPKFWFFSGKSAYEWITYSCLVDFSFKWLCLSCRLWASCRLHLWLCLCVFCLLLMEFCTTSLTSSEDILSPHTQLLVSTNTHFIYAWAVFSFKNKSIYIPMCLRLLVHSFDVKYYCIFSFFVSASVGVHHIEIIIGGDSMLARLLRKTIGAFNTSSNLDVQSSNFRRLFTIWVSIFSLQESIFLV